MAATPDSVTRAIDADVHCSVDSIAQLYPYLSTHWKELIETTEFAPPGSIRIAYPSWAPISTRSAPGTLADIQQGILNTAQVAVLHCYYGVDSYTHPYFGAAIAAAVNMWMSDEWLDQDVRLLASAVVTPQHTSQAVAAVSRIAEDPRFRLVLVPARSAAGYGEQRYWPLWDAVADAGLAIGITAGGSAAAPPTPVNWLGSYFEDYSTATLSFQSHILSMVASGLFERHPDLRIVLMESGCTWVPAFLWRLDQTWKAFQREVPWVREAPSTYIRRHFRFTTRPFDGTSNKHHVRQVIDQLGSDEILMFGSDYPHYYCDGDASEVLDVLTADELVRVRWQNAFEALRLESVPNRHLAALESAAAVSN